jgi:hypothetical protein
MEGLPRNQVKPLSKTVVAPEVAATNRGTLCDPTWPGHTQCTTEHAGEHPYAYLANRKGSEFAESCRSSRVTSNRAIMKSIQHFALKILIRAQPDAVLI